MGQITPVDVNNNLLSFHAIEEEELYILDWTYEDPDCDTNTSKIKVKGIVLCCFLLGVSLENLSCESQSINQSINRNYHRGFLHGLGS